MTVGANHETAGCTPPGFDHQLKPNSVADLPQVNPVLGRKSTNAIVQLGRLGARWRRVMIEGKRKPFRIAHALAIHGFEIVDRHWRRGVRSERVVDLAHDDITGASIDAGFG